MDANMRRVQTYLGVHSILDTRVSLRWHVAPRADKKVVSSLTLLLLTLSLPFMHTFTPVETTARDAFLRWQPKGSNECPLRVETFAYI